MKKQQTKPLQNKEEVQKNPDKHIDQDFPGFPHPPSKEKTIQNKKAGEFDDEQVSDGSANAFSQSENDDLLRGELDDDDQKNY